MRCPCGKPILNGDSQDATHVTDGVAICAGCSRVIDYLRSIGSEVTIFTFAKGENDEDMRVLSNNLQRVVEDLCDPLKRTGGA